MDFYFNETEEKILNAVSRCASSIKSPAFLIGGFVRDFLLNRPSKDMDIVCVGDGIALASQVAAYLNVKRPVIFKKFGTARIQYKDVEVEFVGARKESYARTSRKPDILPGTLQDDQDRRDFTINAMAIDLSNDNFGSFLDPFDGQGDLERRLIRTPHLPNKTFSDDPLRMMRAIRFASQLDFDIEEKTLEGIERNRHRIVIVSQERITEELNKILLSPLPSTGLRLFLDTGLCELVFSELYRLHGVDIQNGKEHKDNFYHTLEVLDNVSMKSTDLWLRWAALLHDIAKPATKRFDRKAGWTFHGHEVLGANMIPKLFRKLKLPLDHKMRFVQKLVRLHLRPIILSRDDITDSAIRRLIFDAGDDIDALMTLCSADITTKNDDKKKRYRTNYNIVVDKMSDIEQSDQLRNWQPPISGELIMKTFGIKPSHPVGIIKDAIREAILDGEIPNDYEHAHGLMITLGIRMGLKRM